MREQLEICNRNLGSIPRDLKSLDKKYLLPKAPDWTKGDDLFEVIKSREILLQQGKIVLSARVMANRSLYYPGDEDSAMNVVWSDDPFFEENPRELLNIAFQLSEMREKNYEAKNEEEKSFLKFVTDERARSLSAPLPTSVSQNRQVYSSSLLVFRSHLPGGILSSVFLPLLVCPEKTRAALILPSRFWGDEWKDR